MMQYDCNEVPNVGEACIRFAIKFSGSFTTRVWEWVSA